MGWYFMTLLALGALVGVLISLARQNGNKAAKLEALKAELKKQAREYKRAQQITDNVYSLSVDDTKRRLHKIANQQR